MSKDKFKDSVDKWIKELEIEVAEIGKVLGMSRKKEKKKEKKEKKEEERCNPELHLHSCVFCGSKDVEVDDIISNRFAVVCNGCKCHGPTSYSSVRAGELWNDCIATT